MTDHSPYSVPDEQREKFEAMITAYLNDTQMERLKIEIAKKLDEIYDKLLDNLRLYFVDDVCSNYTSSVNCEAYRLVQKLLNGDREAMERFDLALTEPWAGYTPSNSDSYGIRKSLAQDHAEFIRNQRIADLEKEVESLTERLKYYDR